jgi:hypothetical protein
VRVQPVNPARAGRGGWCTWAMPPCACMWLMVGCQRQASTALSLLLLPPAHLSYGAILQQLVSLQNPCSFSAGPLLMAAQTTDVLRHMSSVELAKNAAGGQTDRLAALSSHILGQRRCVCRMQCAECTLWCAVCGVQYAE